MNPLFYVIGLITLNLIKYKSIICVDSKNYKPTMKDLDLNRLKNLNETILKEHYTNMKICLSYSRLLLALNCNNKIIDFLNNIKDYDIIERNGNSLIFITWTDDKLLITFRGTVNIDDIITDLNSGLTNIDGEKKNIKVYKGVYNYFTIIKHELIEKIERQLRIKTIKNIYITGHSLGGALSILSSFILSKMYQNIQIYNYCSASMKVGNIEFVNEYKNRNIIGVLLINKADTVTKYPFNKEYRQITSLSSTKNATFNLYPTNNIKRHFPSTYYEGIDMST